MYPTNPHHSDSNPDVEPGFQNSQKTNAPIQS